MISPKAHKLLRNPLIRKEIIKRLHKIRRARERGFVIRLRDIVNRRYSLKTKKERSLI